MKPAGSDVAVYPNDRDKFQMTDAAAPISAGARPLDLKEALLMGIVATAVYYNL